MKQVFGRMSKMTLLASLLLATVVLFSSCTKEDDSGISLTYSLSGSATASQTGNSSNTSSGSGNFTGTYDASTKVMTYTTTWTNLSGAPLSGGLFLGAVGQAGTSVSAWSLGSGLTTSGSFSGSTTLNAQQEAQLLAGNAYYLFNTAAYASGEVRGQISASAQ
jgi:hypothetical protein